MAIFQIFHSIGQYWYHLRVGNGEIVQSSEGYTAKASCENGIQAVKAKAVVYYRVRL